MMKMEQVNGLADKMLKLDIGDDMKAIATTVRRYVELRRKEMELTLKISQQPDNADTLNIERDQVKKEIDQQLLKLEN